MPTFRRTTAALILLLALAGCGDVFGPSREERAEEAWDRWVATAPASYRYELVQSCFCGGPAVNRPVTVIVNDNVVVAAWETATGVQLLPVELRLVPTIEDLFAVVFDAIDTGADELTVEYDPYYGYPHRIDIDYIRNAIDDEVSYRANGLIPL